MTNSTVSMFDLRGKCALVTGAGRGLGKGCAKAMAVELAPWNIRVNTVAPTFVETPMTMPFFEDPAFKQAVFDHIPLKRLGRIEDVAAAVVYLAGDAAAMVTGTSLKVDGGWTAH